MHWSGQYRAALFAEWNSQGLPDPQAHLDRYRAAVADARCPLDLPYAESGPLDRDVVDRVFGFGHVVGGAIAGILGTPDQPAGECADWCARFNIGISLVDFICDESGRLAVLAGLEPFRSLVSGPASPPSSARPEEAVAGSLANGVIAELADLIGSDRALDAMARLFRAELATTRRSLSSADDLVDIERDLRDKSTGPFALMAQRATAGVGTAAGRAEPGVEVATALGAAVGTLFWLADDASDLWTDLSAGSWNVFLVRVAACDPLVVAGRPSPFRDAAILRTLTGHQIASREATSALAALAASLGAADRDPDQVVAELGLIAAALALW